MNLGALRNELRENILHDRSDQIAGTTDYLWSDATLNLYINEAQRKMAREALMIRDNTTPIATQVQTVPFQREYTLHPSVVAVLSAKCDCDRADLARAGHAAFDTYHMPNPYFFDPSSLSALPPGKIVAFDTDEGVSPDSNGGMGVMQFRTYPAPDPVHAQLIRLRVVRMPINDLVNDTDNPEIPREHHLDMLEWAAYLALRIVDHDGGNIEAANNFRASFEDHVTEARKVAMRKLFTPLQWGFGRNGFSYESDGNGY